MSQRFNLEQSLRRALENWLEYEVAMCALAVPLGLFNDYPALDPSPLKHVCWSSNPLRHALVEMLDQLVAVGVLELRDEPERQYRWNPALRGTWEG